MECSWDTFNALPYFHHSRCFRYSVLGREWEKLDLFDTVSIFDILSPFVTLLQADTMLRQRQHPASKLQASPKRVHIGIHMFPFLIIHKYHLHRSFPPVFFFLRSFTSLRPTPRAPQGQPLHRRPPSLKEHRIALRQVKASLTPHPHVLSGFLPQASGLSSGHACQFSGANRLKRQHIIALSPQPQPFSYTNANRTSPNPDILSILNKFTCVSDGTTQGIFAVTTREAEHFLRNCMLSCESSRDIPRFQSTVHTSTFRDIGPLATQ